MCVGNAGDAVLAPAESSRPGRLVCEVCVRRLVSARCKSLRRSLTYGSRRRRRRCNPPGLHSHRQHATRAGKPISEMSLRACSPLALGNIRPPLLPIFRALAVFFETLLLLGEVLVSIEHNHPAAICRRRTSTEAMRKYRRLRCGGNLVWPANPGTYARQPSPTEAATISTWASPRLPRG